MQSKSKLFVRTIFFYKITRNIFKKSSLSLDYEIAHLILSYQWNMLLKRLSVDVKIQTVLKLRLSLCLFFLIRSSEISSSYPLGGTSFFCSERHFEFTIKDWLFKNLKFFSVSNSCIHVGEYLLLESFRYPNRRVSGLGPQLNLQTLTPLWVCIVPEVKKSQAWRRSKDSAQSRAILLGGPFGLINSWTLVFSWVKEKFRWMWRKFA